MKAGKLLLALVLLAALFGAAQACSSSHLEGKLMRWRMCKARKNNNSNADCHKYVKSIIGSDICESDIAEADAKEKARREAEEKKIDSAGGLDYGAKTSKAGSYKVKMSAAVRAAASRTFIDCMKSGGTCDRAKCEAKAVEFGQGEKNVAMARAIGHKELFRATKFECDAVGDVCGKCVCYARCPQPDTKIHCDGDTSYRYVQQSKPCDPSVGCVFDREQVVDCTASGRTCKELTGCWSPQNTDPDHPDANIIMEYNGKEYSVTPEKWRAYCKAQAKELRKEIAAEYDRLQHKVQGMVLAHNTEYWDARTVRNKPKSWGDKLGDTLADIMGPVVEVYAYASYGDLEPAQNKIAQIKMLAEPAIKRVAEAAGPEALATAMNDAWKSSTAARVELHKYNKAISTAAARVVTTVQVIQVVATTVATAGAGSALAASGQLGGIAVGTTQGALTTSGSMIIAGVSSTGGTAGSLGAKLIVGEDITAEDLKTEAVKATLSVVTAGAGSKMGEVIKPLVQNPGTGTALRKALDSMPPTMRHALIKGTVDFGIGAGEKLISHGWDMHQNDKKRDDALAKAKTEAQKQAIIKAYEEKGDQEYDKLTQSLLLSALFTYASAAKAGYDFDPNAAPSKPVGTGDDYKAHGFTPANKNPFGKFKSESAAMEAFRAKVIDAATGKVKETALMEIAKETVTFMKEHDKPLPDHTTAGGEKATPEKAVEGLATEQKPKEKTEQQASPLRSNDSGKKGGR